MSNLKHFIPAVICGVILVLGLTIGVILIASNNDSNVLISKNFKNPCSDVEDDIVTVPVSMTINDSEYIDGVFTASGTYYSPAGCETIGVELLLEGGIIKDVKVTPDDKDLESLRYQNKFIAGLPSLVVGKPIEESFLSGRINGASLTTEGFNQAVGKIIKSAKII